MMANHQRLVMDQMLCNRRCLECALTLRDLPRETQSTIVMTPREYIAEPMSIVQPLLKA